MGTIFKYACNLLKFTSKFYISDTRSNNFLDKGMYTNKNEIKVCEKIGRIILRIEKCTELRKSDKWNVNVKKKTHYFNQSYTIYLI